MTPFLFAPPESAVRISSGRSSGDKWAIVQTASGYNSLFTVAGEFVCKLPATLSHSAQVVFSWTDPDVLYFCEGMLLRSYNVRTGIWATIAAFMEYASLASNHAEGDLTEDGYLALCGIRPDGIEEVFVFNLDGNTKGPVYPQTEKFDAIKATVGGHLLLSSHSGIWDLGGKRLTTANGHACACVDNGRPKLLWCSNDRAEPWRNAVELIDIENPSDVRVLMDFGKLNYAMHLSAGPDFAIVSVYDPTDVLLNQIFKVDFHGGYFPELLHEWRAPYRKGFEPRATVSADGSLILYNVPTSDSCEVWGLRRERPVVAPALPKPIVDEYRLIDYGPYEGRQYRLVQDFVARGGVLVAVKSEMFEKV